MKTAVVIYQSKTGTTKKYAEEITNYLESKGIAASLLPIQTFKEKALNNADYVFLGCWTNGLMVILQHPDKEWNEFAATLPSMPSTKLVFFTTYKILTGSMFRKMHHQINEKFSEPLLELKSRNGFLSVEDKTNLDSVLE